MNHYKSMLNLVLILFLISTVINVFYTRPTEMIENKQDIHIGDKVYVCDEK